MNRTQKKTELNITKHNLGVISHSVEMDKCRSYGGGEEQTVVNDPTLATVSYTV